MCGIAGTLSASALPSTEIWQAIDTALSHRGPDDQGWLTYDGEAVYRGRTFRDLPPARAALLHRRLSILDLSEAGHQPMSSADGRYHLVFNGEIYNYLELKAVLEPLGHAFRSHSDSEVLLAAYAQWGSQVLTRLVGMFAFAILDLRENRLFLARDYFGIKPLYYTQGKHGFAFASEITPLLAFPGTSRRVRTQALYDYVRFGVTDHGGCTLFEDVQQLPAAHYLIVELNSRERHPVPQRYWASTAEPNENISFKEASDYLHNLFLESVALHLRSDVPVGSALSGGIDSSAIVMAMRHLSPNLDIHAFSYIADGPGLSEETWIDEVGRAANARVHKIRLTPEGLVEDLDRLIVCQEQPFASTSIYAQFQIFQSARDAGIKVMLDGQGADELMAGYRTYVPARLASLWRKGELSAAIDFYRKASHIPDLGAFPLLVQAGGLLLPGSLQPLARRFVGKELSPQWLNESYFESRGVALRSPHDVSARDLRTMLEQTATTTVLPALLRYEDRNSMAHSIESRVPFLTPRLADFLRTLPEAFLIDKNGFGKSVFRAAMRGLVPDVVLDRRDKIGFRTPEREWLGGVRPWVEGVLASESARSLPVLRTAAIKNAWLSVIEQRAPFDYQAWRWINLIRWAELFQVTF